MQVSPARPRVRDQDNYFYRLPTPYISARAKVKEHLKGITVILPSCRLFPAHPDCWNAPHKNGFCLGIDNQEFFLAAK